MDLFPIQLADPFSNAILQWHLEEVQSPCGRPPLLEAVSYFG
jgi:hypothetical protein